MGDELNFKDFMKVLDGKLLKHVYLLCGKETFYIDKASEKILSKLKISRQDVFRIDYKEKMPLTEVFNALDSSPLFAKKTVAVIKNATFLFEKENAELLEKILRNILPSSYVIFISETYDKRRKLYKAIEEIGAVLEAEPLKSWQVGEWLEEKLKSIGKTMNGTARRYFNERIDVLPEISLWYLENEMEKINFYVTGKEITEIALRQMMTDPPEMSNFAITNAIDTKNSVKALEIIRTQTRDVGKIPLIVGLLVRHVRQLILAKTLLQRGIKIDELSRPLEVANKFVAKRIGECSRSYPKKILNEAFLALADFDFDFKMGRAGVEALEKIVIKLCNRL